MRKDELLAVEHWSRHHKNRLRSDIATEGDVG